MLGILTLDTAFPRIVGDVGAPETFDFPVMHEVVHGAYVEDVVHRRRETLLPAFVDAGRRLVDAGCTGIATTCGFLVRWQKELTEALPVPVMTSALLQLPLVQRTFRQGATRGSSRTPEHSRPPWDPPLGELSTGPLCTVPGRGPPLVLSASPSQNETPPAKGTAGA